MKIDLENIELIFYFNKYFTVISKWIIKIKIYDNWFFCYFNNFKNESMKLSCINWYYCNWKEEEVFSRKGCFYNIKTSFFWNYSDSCRIVW